MRTWSQTILATAKGKTAMTFDDIGTITVRKGANYIIGFYALIVNTKPTADEASCPQLRVNSNDLGISNMDISAGMIGAEGMAAHQSNVVTKLFVPWSPSITGSKLWHSQITFQVAGIVACTEGFECGIQLVTCDQQPSEAVKNYYLFDKAGFFTGGNAAIEAAGAANSATLADWGSTSPDLIAVDSVARSLVGINYTIGCNAETANVGNVNYANLTCSDIDDFTPQQHLAPAISGALGTVINSADEKQVPYYPFIFDGLPQSKVEILIADISSLTGFTAADGQLAVVWK